MKHKRVPAIRANADGSIRMGETEWCYQCEACKQTEALGLPLTSECPNTEVTEADRAAIANGVDYVEGKWVKSFS